MGVFDRWVMFSEVNGTVLLDGKPVEGAELFQKAERSADERKNRTQTAITNKDGVFRLPAIDRRMGLRAWIPMQPAVHQTIVIRYRGVEYEGWMHVKLSYEANTELDGRPLNLVCELTGEPEREGTHYGICRPA